MTPTLDEAMVIVAGLVEHARSNDLPVDAHMKAKVLAAMEQARAEIDRLTADNARLAAVVYGEVERSVKLMLDHDVPFSIECWDCEGCASGDGVDTHDDAVSRGWSNIEPAPKDWATSHFVGRCPECQALAAKEASRE